MELQFIFLAGAGFCLLKFLEGGNNKQQPKNSNRITLQSICNVLGKPHETAGYQDRYLFPDGEIVVVFYPDTDG
jgi:hypothetical protein